MKNKRSKGVIIFAITMIVLSMWHFQMSAAHFYISKNSWRLIWKNVYYHATKNINESTPKLDQNKNLTPLEKEKIKELANQGLKEFEKFVMPKIDRQQVHISTWMLITCLFITGLLYLAAGILLLRLSHAARIWALSAASLSWINIFFFIWQGYAEAPVKAINLFNKSVSLLTGEPYHSYIPMLSGIRQHPLQILPVLIPLLYVIGVFCFFIRTKVKEQFG